jgi:hypothetical protein
MGMGLEFLFFFDALAGFFQHGHAGDKTVLIYGHSLAQTRFHFLGGT